MTKEEFIEGYCARSDINKAEFDSALIALPCNCGRTDCKGWAAVCNDPRSIKNHNDLYRGEQ